MKENPFHRRKNREELYSSVGGGEEVEEEEKMDTDTNVTESDENLRKTSNSNETKTDSKSAEDIPLTFAMIGLLWGDCLWRLSPTAGCQKNSMKGDYDHPYMKGSNTIYQKWHNKYMILLANGVGDFN